GGALRVWNSQTGVADGGQRQCRDGCTRGAEGAGATARCRAHGPSQGRMRSILRERYHMNHKISRRRQTVAVKRALRELANQLSLFTHRMAGRVGLKSLDVDCLDLISRTGPISPGGLARRAGLHPATVDRKSTRLNSSHV